jgi:hypothetical protein
VSMVTEAPGPISLNGEDDRGTERHERLARGVAALRIRGRQIPLERVLLIAGCVLVPLGVILILLGWYGAAHTTLLEEQVPYLISGGVLGLTLAALGGFFYFGYWLTRQVTETRNQFEQQADAARRQNDQLITALSRIETALAAGSRSTARRAQRSATAGNGGLPGRGDQLVATANGSLLHRPDCEVVANRDDVRSVPAGTPGFTPCRICNPLD